MALAAEDPASFDQLSRYDSLMGSTVIGGNDDQFSQRLADFHNRYWWMDPEASWSLAKAGIGPDDPAASAAAMAAAYQNQQVGGTAFTGYGRTTAPSVHYDSSAAAAYTANAGPAVAASGGNTQIRAQENPVQKIIGADWQTLDDAARSQLSALQLQPVDQTQRLGSGSGASGGQAFQLAGFDTLGPVAQKALVTALHNLGKNVQLTGAAQAAEDNLFHKGQATAVPSVYEGPATVFLPKEVDPRTSGGALAEGFAATQMIGEGIPVLGAGLKSLFLVGNAPFQEVQGQARNIYGALHHEGVSWFEPQSDLGIAAGHVLHGEKVDMGSGIFVDPASPLAQERLKTEQERGLLPGGHVFSLGRQAANAVFEPGSRPYELLSGIVDAGVAVKADPMAWGLKYAGRANQAELSFRSTNSVAEGIDAFRRTGQMSEAARAFQDAGGLSGIRRTVDQRQVESYLTSPDTLPVLDGLDKLPNSYSVWRASNRRLSPSSAAAIVDNTEGAAGVVDILRPELGLNVNRLNMNDVTPGRLSLPDAPGLDRPALGYKPPSGITNILPARFVDGTSASANAIALERAAVFTKMSDKLPEWFDDMARATTESERQGVWQDVASEAFKRGMDKASRQADLLPWVTDANRDVYLANAADHWNRITRLKQSAENADNLYLTDKIGRGQGTFDPALVIDGEPHVVGQSPQYMAQGRQGRIPLPDWRGINQGLSKWAPVLTNPAFRVLDDAVLGPLQNVIWKGLAIGKPSTAVKVVADEQGNMGGRGFANLFTSPLSLISIALATGSAELSESAGFFTRLSQLPFRGVRWSAEHFPGVEAEGRIASNFEGIPFQELNDWKRITGGGLDRATDDPLGAITADNYTLLHRKPGQNDQAFAQWWAGAVAELAASDDVQHMVRAPSLTEAQNVMWDGAGMPVRKKWAAGPGRAELLLRPKSDEWVQRTLQYVDDVTNGNPELRQAIATGQLDGKSLWAGHVDGSPRYNPDVRDSFISRLDDAPLVVKAPRKLYAGPRAGIAALGKQYFDRFMHGMVGLPSATLSKSPLYRQAYWQWATEHAGFLTADAQTKLVALAEGDARLGAKLTGDLRSAIAEGNRNRVPFSGTVNVEQADQLASGHALDMVRQTTHDFTERNQFMDALRVISPFGEALRKGWKRYLNLATTNPQTARRVQQVYQATHSPELNDLLGGDPNEGFFHKDSFGDEVFTVPGSAYVDQALGNVDLPGIGRLGSGTGIPLTGHVRGLSLGTEIFPSAGPVGSYPLAYLVNQLHASPTITQTLFPYGEPRGWSDVGNYLPGWLTKFIGHDRSSSPEAVKAFGGAINELLAKGIVEGTYQPGTPEGMSAAVEDATSRAHGLFHIRALAQFLVPGAPSAQILATDPSGKVWDLQALAEDYRRLQAGVDQARQAGQNPPSAGSQFLDRYGPDLFQAVTPQTWAYTFHLPTTKDSADWLDAHPDVKANAPDLYGYFTPPSDPTKFDYPTYIDQLLPGQGKQALDGKQWLLVSNSKLAAQIYSTQRQKVLTKNNGKQPDAVQRKWLSDVKGRLIDEYPGYSGDSSAPSVPGIAARPAPGLLVKQALSVVDQPTIAATEQGQGLALFAAQYAKVEAKWAANDPLHRPGSWMQSTSPYALSLRTWLRQAGEQVVNDHPAFGPLFEDVFDRAFRDDTAAAVQGGPGG